MVCIANAMCPMQLDDTAGFHTGPPPIALQQCYMRGAEMVKEVAQRMPVLTALTVCVDVKDKPVVPPTEGSPRRSATQGEYQLRKSMISLSMLLTSP